MNIKNQTAPKESVARQEELSGGLIGTPVISTISEVIILQVNFFNAFHVELNKHPLFCY